MVDEHMSQAYIISLHCNERTKAYGNSFSQFISTCTDTVAGQ